MNDQKKRILKMLAEGIITPDEAEELLNAMVRGNKNPDAKSDEISQRDLKKMKYIYVKVLSAQDDNIDIRVPLGLVRAGMKLTTFIPQPAIERINSSMKEKGMNFDMNNFMSNDIEELIKNLTDTEINIKSKNGDNVRVYCGE